MLIFSKNSSALIVNVTFICTRISGPYGPFLLALAEGWLASLTRGFASLTRGFVSLNLSLGASPPSHHILVGTEANKNRQKDGDISTYKQKLVGTEAHTNKQKGGDRSTYELNK
jgi:hypothetical protein